MAATMTRAVGAAAGVGVVFCKEEGLGFVGMRGLAYARQHPVDFRLAQPHFQGQTRVHIRANRARIHRRHSQLHALEKHLVHPLRPPFQPNTGAALSPSTSAPCNTPTVTFRE